MSQQTGTTSRSSRDTARSPRRIGALPGVIGAALALAVSYIHVTDQGGFPGDKSPAYIGIGYYVLEVVAVLVAVALLVPATRNRLATWLLAAAVGAGPMLGYVLTRGPGLPDATDDRGNWGEPLGVASLVVEGLLIILSLACAASLRSPAGAGARTGAYEDASTH
jgi:hypothetical protein